MTKDDDNDQVSDMRDVLFVEEMIELSKEVKEHMDPENAMKRFARRAKWLFMKLGLYKLARVYPLNRMMHKISVKYGSTVLGFYSLAAWTININLFVFIFWFIWVIVPWFKYYQSENWEDEYNNTVLHWDEITLNFVGGNANNRSTDKSWFFYSGYQKHFGDYEMGLIYTVLCICTYIGALLGLTLTIGRQLKDDVVPIGDMKLPVSVYAWDWQVTDKHAVNEKLAGAWIAIQAEYFCAMRRADYFVGQKVKVKQGDIWIDKCLITKIDIMNGMHTVQTQEGGTIEDLHEEDITPIKICGMRPATVRMIIGFTISLLLCAGSLAALYFSVTYKDRMNKDFPFTSAIVVKFINVAIPFIQRFIVSLEKIRDPSVVIMQEVLRVFIIKMCGVIFLYISIKEIESSGSDEQCPEFIIGMPVDHY